MLVRFMIFLLACSYLTSELSAQEAPRTDPSRVNQVIMDAIRASNPKTTTALLRSVNNLVNIAEFEMAGQYLGQATKLETSDEEFAKMVDHFGAAFFLRLSFRRQLQPQIETYTRRAFEAANRITNDPKRLRRWVGKLDRDSFDEQVAALNELRAAGAHGAAAILAALSDPKSKLANKRLESALVEFGPAAQPVLIAGLRSGHDAMPFYALKILRQSVRPRSGNVIPDLLKSCFANGVDPTMQRDCQANVTQVFGRMPSKTEAVEQLTQQIGRLLEPEAQVLPADLDGLTQLWVWNNGQLESRSYPQSIAHLIRATQLAADLFAIDHRTSQPRLLFAATQLGTAKIAGSMARPLQTERESVSYVRSVFSPEELETVLKFCLDHDLIPSATAAAELLAEAGDENNLGYETSRSALAHALRYPNRRVQFAAANTIMKIGPSSPFKGSCDLVKVLTRFADSNGRSRVLVVHPIRSEADLIATDLPSLGFEADIATNGRQAIDCLLRKSDYDLMLVGDSVSSPKWTELVQQMHHLAPQIPLCIMVRSFNHSLALEFAIQNERMHVFPLPYDDDSLAALLRDSLPDSTDPLTFSERREYATESIRHLADLASRRYSDLFDVGSAEPAIVSALIDVQVDENALDAAGLIGTPALQTALVQLSSDSSRNTDTRNAAIAALDVAIERRGLLLTHRQLQAQYRQYNQAIDVGADDVAVLGQILDSIERPSGAISQLTKP